VFYNVLPRQGSLLCTFHVQPQNLPPTAAAARFHSLHIHLQVKQWQGEDAEMLIKDWGWKVIGDQLVPVVTDQLPAPDSLLQFIKCNGLSDCCTMGCLCQKNGMQCSPACGQCKESTCTNSTSTLDYEIEDSEDLYSMCRLKFKNDSISGVKIRNKHVLENVNFQITQHFKSVSFMGLYFKIMAWETLCNHC